MKNTPIALLLGAALAACLTPTPALAGSAKPAATKEDASEIKSIQQQLQDIDMKVSVLRTDGTKIDATTKMTPEARAEAIKDATEAVNKATRDIADAAKAKKINAGHAKSFGSRLHDSKGFLDDAAKKAKETKSIEKKTGA